MKLERSRPEDAEECVKWMLANLVLNDCSPRTLKGSLFYKIDGVLYLPIKPVIMLESLAPNPEVTGNKRLLAIRRAMDDLVAMYPGTEFIFLTHGDTRLDEAARYYGFKEEPYRVYRLIAGSKTRSKDRPASKKLAEARLRDHSRADGIHEISAKRSVSDMRAALGKLRSEESSGSRPHQGNEDRPGNHPQPLQFSHRARS